MMDDERTDLYRFGGFGYWIAVLYYSYQYWITENVNTWGEIIISFFIGIGAAFYPSISSLVIIVPLSFVSDRLAQISPLVVIPVLAWFLNPFPLGDVGGGCPNGADQIFIDSRSGVGRWECP